ncbi:MAG: response regulator [Eubacterium sp.]|nr:response regulator [Eubacterium sp.]
MVSEGMITIVSSSEGFFTKGLQAKLEEIGVGSQFVTLNEKNKRVDLVADETDIFVLYMQDEVEPDFLYSFSDILSIHSREVIVIGESDEYDKLQKNVSDRLIKKWFDRPLDMNAFLDFIRTFYDKDDEPVKKTILIVDDDMTYMRLIYDWLKDEYNVGMANSGVQAISWLVKNRADLVLMDYEMPIVSGPQVFEMLKTDAVTGKIPVMFLTGKNDREVVMEVVNLKPVDYLLKTISKEGLLGKLRGFFRNHE